MTIKDGRGGTLFVEEYLQDLRSERYRPAACARYVSRCWAKARGDVASNPDAARSIVILGLVYFGVAFVGSVALALTSDLQIARSTLTLTGIWLIFVTGGLMLHIDLLRDREGYPLSAINFATALTALRLVLIPALAIALLGGYWKTAFWLFVAGGLSDVADGWVARRWKQETRLGQILDPITDTLFHLTLFLSMWGAGLVGPWILTLAVIRHGGLLLGGVFIHLARGPVKVQSTLPGKLSGFVGAVMVGFVLLVPAYGAGSLETILTPLVHDGLIVLLAGSVVHGVVMGWFNYKHAHLAAEQARRVIKGVRFGEKSP